MEFIEDEEEVAILRRQLINSSIGVMNGFPKVAGEVRKVNVVYYLCINGKKDQPHLIRVHIQQKAVRLRDVKRWLSELRGKDMPDSFSWSYKRRYKSGHVWQDLMDDDLITPICDNEYILKGSQLPSSSPFSYSVTETFSCEASSPVPEPDEVEVEMEEKQMTPPKTMHETRRFEPEEDDPPKSPPQFDMTSPESQHEPTKPEITYKIEIVSDEEETEEKDDNKKKEVKQEAPCWSADSVSAEVKLKSKSKSNNKRKTSRVILDIVACRRVQPSGSPLLSANPRGRKCWNMNPLNCVTGMFPLCLRTPVKDP